MGARVAMKTCTSCKIEKSSDLFADDMSRLDGKYCYCKDCLSAKNKKSRYEKKLGIIDRNPIKYAALDCEEFVDVLDYEGEYQVSNFGRVRSVKNYNMILSVGVNTHGYNYVTLSKNNKVKTFTVHKLVMEAFVSRRPSGLVVNHKDGVKTNNRIENLEWVTVRENVIHSRKVLKHVGVNPPIFNGEEHPMSKLKREDVVNIRLLHCRGRSFRSIAREFGVSKTNVRNIINGIVWRNIT